MWNISEATDEQRETMVTAFKAEQKVYADAGEKDRAKAVQASIDLWTAPSKAQVEAAAAAVRLSGERQNLVLPSGGRGL